MKTLYYLSFVLSAPFYAVAWALYGISAAFDWVGATIHDKTTYRVWRVLHARWCAENLKNRNRS